MKRFVIGIDVTKSRKKSNYTTMEVGVETIAIDSKERKKDVTKGRAQLVRVGKYEGYGRQKVHLSELSCERKKGNNMYKWADNEPQKERLDMSTNPSELKRKI